MNFLTDIQTVGQGLWDSAVLALGKVYKNSNDVLLVFHAQSGVLGFCSPAWRNLMWL